MLARWRGCSLVRHYLEAGKGKCRVVTNMRMEFFQDQASEDLPQFMLELLLSRA